MIIKYPLSTEKSMRLMQAENKMVFIVDENARKPEIKKALEKMFDVKIIGVNTQRTMKGTKKAYVKFAPDTLAIDIATKLGLM